MPNDCTVCRQRTDLIHVPGTHNVHVTVGKPDAAGMRRVWHHSTHVGYIAQRDVGIVAYVVNGPGIGAFVTVEDAAGAIFTRWYR